MCLWVPVGRLLIATLQYVLTSMHAFQMRQSGPTNAK